MKNFTLMLFCCISLFLTSCEKDDANSNNAVVGSWELTEFNYTGTTTTTVSGSSSVASITAIGTNLDAIINFKSDGSYTSSGTYTAEIVATSNGIEINQSIDVQEFLGFGEYMLDSETNPTSMVIIDQEGNESTVEISSYLANKMVLSIEIDETKDAPDGNGIITNDFTTYYVLEKQ